MNVFEGSLVYRAARPCWRWLSAVARPSLVGRFLLAVLRAATRVGSDSGTLGTARVASRAFARTGHPLVVLAVSRPYLWLRRVVGESPVGRAARAGETQLTGSRLARGWWVPVTGAGIFALGCGRVVLLLRQGVSTVDNTTLALAHPGLRLATPILVLLAGGLMLLSGPRVVSAFGDSLIGRATGLAIGRAAKTGKRGASAVPAEAPQDRRWFVFALTLLALIAGAAAGLVSGSFPFALVLVVLLACAVVLVLVRPEALLLVVAVFPWVDWVARRALGGLGGAWDDALLVVAICLLLWCVLVLRRWELWTVPIMLPVALAFVAALGSVAANHVPSGVGIYALRILFEPLLFYFLGFLFPKDKRWVRAVIALFILAGVFLALHGLYQYVTHAPMPKSWVDVREKSIGTRAYSIIQNPNGLGAFLLMGALISMSMTLAAGRRWRYRLAWAAACVIHLGGIAVTFSRGAWIALAAGVIVLFVMAYRRFLVPVVGAAVIAWFVAPRTFVNRLTFAFSSAYITKSSEAGRLYVWRMALSYIGDHPWFGVGLGTFGGTTAVTFGYSRLWVDSFYLQLGAEGGLLLLVFFLWILLRTGKGLIKGYGQTKDGYLRALSAGVFAAFVAVVVANITASVWETLTVGVGFWFLTGFVTSATLHEQAQPGGEVAPSGPAEPAEPKETV